MYWRRDTLLTTLTADDILARDKIFRAVDGWCQTRVELDSSGNVPPPPCPVLCEGMFCWEECPSTN